MPESDKINKDEKWEFADYAFTITGVIVGGLLVGPEIMEAQFGISILGGSLSNAAPEILEGLEHGQGPNAWSINQLRALSPMLFLLTTTIVFFKEAFDARKSGGYTGSMFTHTFESLFEEAIYMAITTIMVYGAILFGAMYASWLAGPISWILFVFIFPLAKKKSDSMDEVDTPWLLLFIFIAGIIVEVITWAWIAFPLAWLIICAFKLVEIIREKIYTMDTVFNIMYYAFSIILMAVGVSLNFWMASWVAFPVALLVCWILSKFGRFKKAQENAPD